jgi:hypothetical protein
VSLLLLLERRLLRFDFGKTILSCRIKFKLLYFSCFVLLSLALEGFFEIFVQLIEVRRVSRFHYTLCLSALIVWGGCFFGLFLKKISFHSWGQLCLDQALLSCFGDLFFPLNLFFFLFGE